jgi:two-component system cell cycle sensor histidine kinase/response regulator CckA
MLFVSGYTSDIIAKQGIIEDSVFFLQMPFVQAELTRKVREVLDAGPAPQ